ncbi:MAG: tetratricopeptide repeat protein [Terriglobia bacterium]
MRVKTSRETRHTSRAHPPTKPFLDRFRRWELLVILAALVCDWNSWGHQFVMDDLSRIVRNPLIRDPHRLFEIFLSPYNFLYGMPSGLYRPLTTLSFALNDWITGLSPDGFHAVNRLLHVLACLGILWVVRRLISDPTVAGVTALLFAAHPIQTEAITYMSGRSDSLVMVLFVFAWLFFIRARTSVGRGSYGLSLIFYFLALLSKESAITWLGVALLTEFVFFSDRDFKTFWTHVKEHFTKWYAGYLVVTAAYLALRFYALKEISRVAVTFLDNPLAHVTSPVRIFTALKILIQSLGLLLWPIHLSADYSYNEIPLSSPAWNPATLAILVLTGILLFLLVWSYRRASHIFFGLGFFLTTYFLVSNLLIPIGTIRADRLLYLPSLGIFLAGGIGFVRIMERVRGAWFKKASYLALALILILLATRTIFRNRIWFSEFTLYFQTVRDAPRSAKAHNNLGAQYFSRGELKPALEQYQIAETIKPDYPDLLNNMGSLFSREGRSEEAITYLNRAVSLSPENPVIRNNYGLALKAHGDLPEAIAQYDLILQQSPGNADAHFNKANTLVAQNRIGEAIIEYNHTLEIDPSYTLARTNLNRLLQKANPVNSKP